MKILHKLIFVVYIAFFMFSQQAVALCQNIGQSKFVKVRVGNSEYLVNKDLRLYDKLFKDFSN